MGRIYTSVRGKEIDMEKLSLRNEKTPAVGNMKVNARGDEVNDYNEVIRTRNEQVHQQYQQQAHAPQPGQKGRQ